MKFHCINAEFSNSLAQSINFWLSQHAAQGKKITITSVSYSTFINAKQKDVYSALIGYTES